MGRDGIRPVQSIAEHALMLMLSGSSQPYGSFFGVLGFFGGFMFSFLSRLFINGF